MYRRAIAAGVSARFRGDVECRTRRAETGEPPKPGGRNGRGPHPRGASKSLRGRSELVKLKDPETIQ
jgi:hypothetical protein